jgi:hypothetical protein
MIATAAMSAPPYGARYSKQVDRIFFILHCRYIRSLFVFLLSMIAFTISYIAILFTNLISFSWLALCVFAAGLGQRGAFLQPLQPIIARRGASRACFGCYSCQGGVPPEWPRSCWVRCVRRRPPRRRAGSSSRIRGAIAACRGLK